MRDTKIYGIGLGRTGTLTLATALRQLGYRVAHWSELYPVTRADLTLPKETFEHYDAFLDALIPAMYEELWAPEDKFILTMRDVNDWYVSMAKHRKRSPSTKLRRDMRRVLYDTDTDHEPTLKYAFLRHEIRVKNFFRDKDNLLILNICDGEGWEKLCPFLGKDVPDKKFPHKNKGS